MPTCRCSRTRREWRLSLPCGLTWVSRCEIASWWHDRKKRTLNVALYAVGLLVLVCCAQDVLGNRAGYCDCGGGRREKLVDCSGSEVSE